MFWMRSSPMVQIVMSGRSVSAKLGSDHYKVATNVVSNLNFECINAVQTHYWCGACAYETLSLVEFHHSLPPVRKSSTFQVMSTTFARPYELVRAAVERVPADISSGWIIRRTME
jgi:hypothetical protein